MTIKETILVDKYGDFAAISVSLEDVSNFIKQNYKDLKTSINYEDYDDYGCEHYIEIEGKCANLIIRKNYGGRYCPDNYLECFIVTKNSEDKSFAIQYKHKGVSGGIATTYHFYSFNLKNDFEEVKIHKEYEKNLKIFLDKNIKYLQADSKLFYRVDNIQKTDRTGEFKWGNNITSFDAYRVDDDDFYTDSIINHNAKRHKLIAEKVKEVCSGKYD